jgi:hypothetical protein
MDAAILFVDKFKMPVQIRLPLLIAKKKCCIFPARAYLFITGRGLSVTRKKNRLSIICALSTGNK